MVAFVLIMIGIMVYMVSFIGATELLILEDRKVDSSVTKMAFIPLLNTWMSILYVWRILVEGAKKNINDEITRNRQRRKNERRRR
jgi:NhaP-type Na+/H+ or K+/H+ antiporter